MVAPATIAATSERSRPREMMTIPIPQLRITSAAEFDAMTFRFPSVANPWMKTENSGTTVKMTPITTYSSRLSFRRPPGSFRVTSDTEPHLGRARSPRGLARLGQRRDIQ